MNISINTHTNTNNSKLHPLDGILDNEKVLILSTLTGAECYCLIAYTAYRQGLISVFMRPRNNDNCEPICTAKLDF